MDLTSLYNSLSQQMEQYFKEIAFKMEGYEEFEKEAWSFKVHLNEILEVIFLLALTSSSLAQLPQPQTLTF